MSEQNTDEQLTMTEQQPAETPNPGGTDGTDAPTVEATAVQE